MELEQWLVVATAVATGLGAAGVLGQVALQRRQRNLHETAAFRQQAEAWASLDADWQSFLVAATGPAAVRNHGVPVATYEKYLATVESYRLAHIGWLSIYKGQTVHLDARMRAEAAEHVALETLNPYRTAAHRTVTHLAQVSTLILRRRLTIESVYDALGPNILRLGDGLHSVLKQSDTPLEHAPWQRLTAFEVSQRIDWNALLNVGHGTAERVALLSDLLAAHAIRVGDAAIVGTHEEDLGDRLANADRLAIAWRAARPFGLRRACGVVWKLASAGRRTRRRFAWSLPLPFDVVKAAFAARKAPDESPRPLLSELQNGGSLYSDSSVADWATAT